MNPRNEILIVNHPYPDRINLAADLLAISKSSAEIRSNYRLVAYSFAEPTALLAFAQKVREEAPDAFHFVSLDESLNLSRNDLLRLHQTAGRNLKFCDFVAAEFEDQVKSALTNVPRPETSSAGDKSQRRKTSRRSTAKVQIESLHRALLAVHSAQSVAEVETLLHSALADTLSLSWVRVFLHSGDHLDTQLERIQNQTLFKAPLVIGARPLGRIVFARQELKNFLKSEEEALQQISESVALALDRLAKLAQAETLTFQWDSTFDAISEPLCLTDENFGIIRTNRAFLDTTSLSLQKVLGSNCFSAFCGPTAPAQLDPSDHALILQRSSNSESAPRTYQVTTQRIQVGRASESILLVMFRDITEQKKIEKQIFESAKMAELGTIGSSIAHDINNPLGGMLSFLQLIKMDLTADDAIYDDIIEMEKAGLRCKEIVENLLSFSRRQESGKAEPVSLVEVVRQALKITELRARSLGVEMKVNSPENPTKIMGHFNLLSQALSHILQNAFDAVSEKLARKPGYHGEVHVDISDGDNGPTVVIVDNGIGISPELQNKILNPLFSTKIETQNQGLGLTLAYQIVDEHGGRLEIFSRPNVGTTVKISFLNV